MNFSTQRNTAGNKQENYKKKLDQDKTHMLPGHMMVRVGTGFVEPVDIQNIVETLQKRASGRATALVAALKRAGQCGRFLLHSEYQQYKMHGCTEAHFLSVFFFVHLPLSPRIV